jgi:hypothetical protein
MYSSYPTGVYRRAYLLIRGRFPPLMAKGFSRSLSFSKPIARTSGHLSTPFVVSNDISTTASTHGHGASLEKPRISNHHFACLSQRWTLVSHFGLGI